MIKLVLRLRVGFAIIALSTVLVVPATHSSNLVTDAELAMLPEYCQARLGKNEVAYNTWKQRLGPSIFVHVHHYCFGLNFMSRANMEFDPKKKKHILKQAIRNFDYVLARWPSEFSLTPSATVYRQQAEMMLTWTQ